MYCALIVGVDIPQYPNVVSQDLIKVERYYKQNYFHVMKLHNPTA